MKPSPSLDRCRAWIIAAFVVATLLAASIGGIFTPGAWYDALAKPEWTPPGWIFGPVWALIYFLIAAAGVVAWDARSIRRRALGWWATQMILNAAWSWVFFGLHSPGLALAVIAVMLVSIVGFIRLSWRPARLAAWLFMPYLGWVSFASILNYSIVMMN